MKKIVLIVLLSFVAVLACAPRTFIRTMDPGWNTVELRDDITYETAWKSTVDLISRKFDIEILSRDDGYIRTAWLYSWTGELEETYKVRAVIKFTPDKRVAEVKSEAQNYSSGFLGIGRGWVMGTDELLVTTLRTDLMGKIGRVSR
jgi:hypothetical protein